MSCRGILSCRKSVGNLRSAWAKAQVCHQTHKPGFSKQLDLPPLCHTLYAQGAEQAAVPHIGWKEAPKHEINPVFLQVFFASILSLICTSSDFSSKFSHHVVPHVGGHSLHYPTRRISWLHATRKMSKIRQLSLQNPQVIYSVPFYHFQVKEELPLGRPLEVVLLSFHHFQKCLGEDVPPVRGFPQGHPVSPLTQRHHKAPWGNRKDTWSISGISCCKPTCASWWLCLLYWLNAIAWQHSILRSS